MSGPSYDLIVAAVGGDKEALEKIIQHYEPIIDEKCGGNELVRRQVTEALRKAIQHYELNNRANNEAYLRENYPEKAE